MEIRICENAQALGLSAAQQTAQALRECIQKQGYARIALSTGASQFETLAALVKQDVDWSKVEMFHLDEYVDLPITHPASFRKYLQERFVDQLPMPLKAVNFVDGTQEGIAALTAEIRRLPIDIGLIGIGENSHIAFNDPPADFDTKEAYIVVDLDDRCKKQQMGEGWFPTLDSVPKQAVSLTVHQILSCKKVMSCVPHAVKSWAVCQALTQPVSNKYPATALRGHADWTLYIDRNSAAEVVKF